MKANATLLHVFPSFAVGGSQMRFAALANHFGGRFRHAIVAMDGRTDCLANLRAGLDIDLPKITLRRRDTIGNVRRFRSLLRRGFRQLGRATQGIFIGGKQPEQM